MNPFRRRLNGGTTIAVGIFLMVAMCLKAEAQTRSTPCNPATPNNAICVSWSAVTKGTLEETLTGVTYRVEKKAGTGSFITASTGQAGLTFYDQNLAPGTYTYRVYANCTNTGCIESFASNETSRAATPNPIQPNTPVIVIAAIIREGQPPIFRIIQAVNLRPNELILVAPASMRPVFAAR